MSSAVPTVTLTPDHAGLSRAAEFLTDGALVAFPTETVYGLGADARNDTAVARIFEAKGRPRFNPLIVHLPNMDVARTIADFPELAERLADAFWPGPLTLVVPLRPDSGLSPLVTAGNDTVALRVPEHPVAHDLLTTFAGPVAAPSANPSGKVSPTRAEHVLEGLTGRIEAVVDGGACGVGVESTIIGFDGGPTLLRPGGLPTEVIEECIGQPLAARGENAGINAPGQLTSHYAPGAPVRLNATAPDVDEVWLGFGPDCKDAALNLSPTGDLVEAAANLFHHLRAIDALANTGQVIAIAPVPEHGLGRAINDRLRRAAAPRS
ncbi:L-threonylcarbamoyladenylate synthase [Actibacterium lipolyticum]|uniref:Threonylcarbamoyl-AMP synthase n=1 Tax=Actibacterium lipolyticum TaxID=1524263 RepID=A0A238KSF7_9RHOB|nr:L-threonylcarbamoyladenylate synthase [Actibacterium lipolyticum]SMX45769.1 Threonylcarbamoyl-AMP synthase [Actibacterium lipolyticum]